MRLVFCPNCSGVTTKLTKKILEDKSIIDYVCDYDNTIIRIEE